MDTQASGQQRYYLAGVAPMIHPPPPNRFITRGASSSKVKALRADGEEFFIEAAIARIDVAGEKLLAVSIRDVTARERAEALLRESEERYRAVVQHVVDGVITIDQHGIIRSVNVAAERLFGYSAAELRGKNVALLMPEPYQSQHDGYIASYRETGQAKIIGIGREVFGRRKNGSVFPIDLAIS